jgi:hypothetical protein
LDQKLLFRGYGFAWLAAPTAIFVAAIILADSYSDPKKRWPLKPLLAPTLGVVLTFATGLIHRWALPVPVLALGDAIGMLIVSTLRVTFPPLTERPQAANMPTFWQKLELSLPSFSLKKVILPCLFLLAIIMFLLITHP